MKAVRLNLTKKILLVPLAIGVMFFSCSTKTPFLTSNVVPGAHGSVKVKRDKNANYNIELSVISLADPARLDPPKNTYMVWVETEQDRAKNIGLLKTSSSLFSKTMKSSLETVTSYKPTRVFITAEDDVSAQYPGQVVLETAPFFIK
jgi:hypothetical protein